MQIYLDAPSPIPYRHVPIIFLSLVLFASSASYRRSYFRVLSAVPQSPGVRGLSLQRLGRPALLRNR